jgi:hypothetical protein
VHIDRGLGSYDIRIELRHDAFRWLTTRSALTEWRAAVLGDRDSRTQEGGRAAPADLLDDPEDAADAQDLRKAIAGRRQPPVRWGGLWSEPGL